MPSSGIILLLAIITADINDTAQLWWHWLQGDTCSHGIPGGHHAFASLGGLLADRTTRIMSCQLAETFPVNRMATRHFVRSTSRTEEEFLTDRTVGFVFPGFAVVVGVEAAVNAHATIVTVLEIFSSPDPAESTICTVIRPLIIGHPEIANIAVVFSELDPALDTIIGFAGLPCKALPTNNFLDGKPINIVVGILRDLLFHGGETARQRSTTMHPVPQLDLGWQNRTIIVTDATTKSSTAARGNHGTIALVVGTGRTRLFHSPNLLAGLETVFAFVAVGSGVDRQGRTTGPRVVRGRIISHAGGIGRHTGIPGNTSTMG